MKFPVVFELTKREQRTVILIMMALLAAAITKYYRDQPAPKVPLKPTSAQVSATPSPTSAEDETGEPGE